MSARRPVFRLPTLAVSTGQETPVVPADPPYELTSGGDPALAVVEGAYRPEGTVARFVQPRGLIAIRVTEPLPPLLRVSVTLRTDRLSDDRWTERVARQRQAQAVRGVAAPADPPIDPHGRVRSVAVSGYDRLGGTAQLVNDGTESGWVRQRVVLDLTADEFESGMLLLGFGPGPAVDGALPEPLVGVCVTRIRINVPAAPPAEAVTGWRRLRARFGSGSADAAGGRNGR